MILLAFPLENTPTFGLVSTVSLEVISMCDGLPPFERYGHGGQLIPTLYTDKNLLSTSNK